jgi:hypothetical protein
LVRFFWVALTRQQRHLPKWEAQMDRAGVHQGGAGLFSRGISGMRDRKFAYVSSITMVRDGISADASGIGRAFPPSA